MRIDRIRRGEVLRISARAIAALAALAVLICLASYAVNFFDEDLTTDASALLSLPTNHYDSADNIYIALAGFDAAPQSSFIPVGEARIAKYNRDLDSMLANPRSDLAGTTGTDPKAISFKGDLALLPPSGFVRVE